MKKQNIKDTLMGVAGLMLAVIGVVDIYMFARFAAAGEVFLSCIFLVQWLIFNGAAIYCMPDSKGNHSLFLEDDEEEEW